MIRQEYLETAIEWIAMTENKSVDLYMSEHQHDSTAAPLWLYFKSVIDWVNTIFPHYRKEMKGLEWGRLYHEYRNMNRGAIRLMIFLNSPLKNRLKLRC